MEKAMANELKTYMFYVFLSKADITLIEITLRTFP